LLLQPRPACGRCRSRRPHAGRTKPPKNRCEPCSWRQSHPSPRTRFLVVAPRKRERLATTRPAIGAFIPTRSCKQWRMPTRPSRSGGDSASRANHGPGRSAATDQRGKATETAHRTAQVVRFPHPWGGGGDSWGLEMWTSRVWHGGCKHTHVNGSQDVASRGRHPWAV
jgi:hypothetical protein